MKRFLALLLLCHAPFVAANDATSTEIVHWQDNSLSYLYGDNFKVNPKTQQTITFEHASGWNIGDLFMFVDFTKYNGEEDFLNGETTYYGEFAPRFSFSKMLDKPVEMGFVKDVLIATTVEFGEGDVESFLIGAGFDLAIPGFDFFQLNMYKRLPDGRDGDTWQITPTWKMSWPVGESTIVFDGFIDWVVDSDGSYEKNFHFNPQLKYDLGKQVGLGDSALLVGIEYDYWKNKYGIKSSSGFDTDQSVTSLLVKYHF
ncbi:hypothetical protein BCU84_00300 [Shewanella sp. 10N.286.51.B7]|uniref:outer membrane protein OmpK n=1 Tax=Shewanella sp. 10N.286.51.B7 TaxID=1880836 RepID=UPI000C84275C|nr:outer membrane protein OmpK [Shewanella sp. 10N.286.51.B7]PMG80932.1 hypothetical protein BCU84_00300 [Shewanella sp. 10N.286.51.B7]